MNGVEAAFLVWVPRGNILEALMISYMLNYVLNVNKNRATILDQNLAQGTKKEHFTAATAPPRQDRGLAQRVVVDCNRSKFDTGLGALAVVVACSVFTNILVK